MRRRHSIGFELPTVTRSSASHQFLEPRSIKDVITSTRFVSSTAFSGEQFMCFRAAAFCIGLILAVLSTSVAQEVQPKPAAKPQAPSAAPKSPANKKLSAAAKAKADEQKALALSLLVSLATDAR